MQQNSLSPRDVLSDMPASAWQSPELSLSRCPIHVLAVPRLQRPTRKPLRASVFSTHSDTQALLAFHCMRVLERAGTLSFREGETTIKIEFALFGGGGQGGPERKIVQNAIFHGKRHDNKI